MRLAYLTFFFSFFLLLLSSHLNVLYLDIIKNEDLSSMVLSRYNKLNHVLEFEKAEAVNVHVHHNNTGCALKL